ncbi:MAG: hypothetical protein OEO83_05590 [Alphaproteobacteria bacterium]|nr:hypothetical protein [Alphaproteobacteria bacterium]
MSVTSDSEHQIATAAAKLCEHELTPEIRFQISLMTILATGIMTTVATCLILLATWQFSLALLSTIWLWAVVLAIIFYFNELPRIFGFGAVTGAFEDSHHQFFEGPLTAMTKSLRFRPRNRD